MVYAVQCSEYVQICTLLRLNSTEYTTTAQTHGPSQENQLLGQDSAISLKDNWQSSATIVLQERIVIL